jgi:hypothetical protein
MIVLLIFIGLGFVSPAEAAGTVKGKIADASNNNPLPYANVVILGTKFGAIARENGNYTIHDVPPGTYTVQASYVGFRNASKAQIAVAEGGTVEIDFVLIRASVADGLESGSASLGDLVSAIGRADSLAVLEGLPNRWTLIPPDCDSTAIASIANYWFFKDRTIVDVRKRQAIAKAMTAKDAFEPWSGEKLCGGFHPDYCLQWHCGTEIHRALLCFGCHEVIYAGPKGSMRYDIGDNAYDELRDLLATYKTHHPCKRY